jgi:hypothetical protein
VRHLRFCRRNSRGKPNHVGWWQTVVIQGDIAGTVDVDRVFQEVTSAPSRDCAVSVREAMGDRNPAAIFYRRRDSGHSSTGAIGLAIKWLRAALTKTATFANAMRLAG